jgi:hypothetical protein
MVIVYSYSWLSYTSLGRQNGLVQVFTFSSHFLVFKSKFQKPTTIFTHAAEKPLVYVAKTYDYFDGWLQESCIMAPPISISFL